MVVAIAGLLAACGQAADDRTASSTTSTASVAVTEPSGQAGAVSDQEIALQRDRADDVEAVMDFYVGGDPYCTEPVSRPVRMEYYRPDGVMVNGEVGWPLVFCLPAETSADITVTFPDGDEERYASDNGLFVITPRPTDPLGEWSISIDTGTEVVEDLVEVTVATQPRISVPLEVELGGEGRPADTASTVVLAGYEPPGSARVAVYRSSDVNPSQADFVGYFDIATDDGGAAAFDLGDQELEPGRYFVIANPADPEIAADASSEVSPVRAIIDIG